jgi:hypothetical protein
MGKRVVAASFFWGISYGNGNVRDQPSAHGEVEHGAHDPLDFLSWLP